VVNSGTGEAGGDLLSFGVSDPSGESHTFTLAGLRPGVEKSFSFVPKAGPGIWELVAALGTQSSTAVLKILYAGFAVETYPVLGMDASGAYPNGFLVVELLDAKLNLLASASGIKNKNSTFPPSWNSIFLSPSEGLEPGTEFLVRITALNELNFGSYAIRLVASPSVSYEGYFDTAEPTTDLYETDDLGGADIKAVLTLGGGVEKQRVFRTIGEPVLSDPDPETGVVKVVSFDTDWVKIVLP
jgi:hypothetical protein